MPWITRGLRDGLLTTRWPKRRDGYFDGFPASVSVLAGGSASDPSATDAAEDLTLAAQSCPTGAIDATDSRHPRLDRGRCILCGRCVGLAPTVFGWQPGSAVAVTDRQTLVVPESVTTQEPEDEAIVAVRRALAKRVRGLRRSVHLRHVDCGSDGSDEWELQALTNPVYDLHRLGIFFTASPRHADLLLVTGLGAAEMVEPLRRTLAAMPQPTAVIAVGTDAISGGLIGRAYAGANGVGPLIEVDVWVPGSPATPFAVLHGILLALDRVGTQPTTEGVSR